MTRFKSVGAAAVLAVLMASPASADQLETQEPGMWAFDHPNGDSGTVSARPAADAQAMAPRLVMSHSIVARHVKPRK